MAITVEVSQPKWLSQESAYEFLFQTSFRLKGEPIPNGGTVTLPDLAKDTPFVQEILRSFLEKTKQFFVTPLQFEVVMKYLTHHIDIIAPFPKEEGFSKPLWKPMYLKMKSSEFGLHWSVVEWTSSEPFIQSNFFRPQTSTQQSPELPPNTTNQPNLRTIHIQNTMDSLIPMGDLPLSDLPPLNFIEETPEKKEVRRRIREARLKVELAKLKAKRMEQRYYERYGEADESSLESSESDSMGEYSYS